MAALDFVQRISQRVQEILVGGDDRAVEVELDHGLRLADGRDLAGMIDVDLIHAIFLGLDGRLLRGRFRVS